MVILDDTAGNRMIWGKNKHPEGVIFFDKEPNLAIPADVIGAWDKLPFKDDSFDCVIFDPPHQVASPKTKWASDPKGEKCAWYGYFRTRHQLRAEIYKAQKEFARVSSRLCLKWYDGEVEISRFLTLFTQWKPVFIQKYVHNTKTRRNNENGETYWVKMVRRRQVLNIGDDLTDNRG